MLVAHLLKWKHQPTHRGKSWRLALREQRYQLAKLIKKNPSLLKPKLEETLMDSYPSAVRAEAHETEFEEDYFPTKRPWIVAQVLDADFYPEA